MNRVTIWTEARQDRTEEAVRAVYPQGMGDALAQAVTSPGVTVRLATLDMPEHGLTQAVLDATDVLLWWGHVAHEEVADEVVRRVQARVLDGMGLICLHSAHASKIFHALMGTRTLNLRWREDDELCRLWVMDPAHPIAAGLPDHVDIPQEETYGEYFEIPAPDDLVFVSWYPGGEVFRSGCCWCRGLGRVFFFQPGHETCPVYWQPEIQRILQNAVAWAAPSVTGRPFSGHCRPLQG
ncbi:MAG: ThuA domain-containing protein [Oscillospiraceae bacterium]|jgi:trehalose utilization protein|nr:ThuA domain-containing protein [Oscillospiraceae bacterium]